MTNNSVTISQAQRILANLFTSGRKFTPLLQGAPGSAKTALIRQVTKAIGYDHTVELILSQKAPEHITGYPHIIDGVLHYARPHWWPTKPRTVLFVDEIGQCQIAVQNVAMQLIHERRVGPHVLPDDCIVIAAGNRAEDRAGSTVLQTALRSRFYPVLEVNPECGEWCQHAVQSDFNPYVIAYVKQIAKKVMDFDPREKGGFMSTRTLEQASDVMFAFNSDVDNPDLVASLYGILGDRHASGLVAFVQTLARLPSYDDIASDPMTAPVVEDMVDAVARMLAGHARFTHMAKVVAYISRYPAEAQARLVRDLPGSVATHPDVETLRRTLGLD